MQVLRSGINLMQHQNSADIYCFMYLFNLFFFAHAMNYVSVET